MSICEGSPLLITLTVKSRSGLLRVFSGTVVVRRSPIHDLVELLRVSGDSFLFDITLLS